MIGEPCVFQKKISIPIYMDLFYAYGLPLYIKYKDPRESTPIFQNIGICDLNFWIFPLAFAKNGHFLDFYQNFLKYCKFDGPKTFIQTVYNMSMTRKN